MSIKFIGRNTRKENRSEKLHIFTQSTSNPTYAYPFCNSFPNGFNIKTEIEKVIGFVDKDKICKHCLKELAIEIEAENKRLATFTDVEAQILTNELPDSLNPNIYPAPSCYGMKNLHKNNKKQKIKVVGFVIDTKSKQNNTYEQKFASQFHAERDVWEGRTDTPRRQRRFKRLRP